MERQNLYFIAIVPPEAIREEIMRIQNDLSDRFHTMAALKVVPHITLKAPFKVPANQHENVVQWFSSMAVKTAQFVLELKNFGSFPNLYHPVIYINPVGNLGLLDLQKQIIWKFRAAFPDEPVNNLELAYKPHLTVAYRDLQPDLFKEAWLEYSVKKYAASFEVAGFQLLQHDGRQWKEIKTFDLS